MAAPSNTPAVEEPPVIAPLVGPPEADLWQEYGNRIEFPFAAVGTVFLHVLAAAVIIFMLSKLRAADEDTSGVPVKLVNVDGLDDSGEGSAGSGGSEEAIKADDALTLPAEVVPLKELQLPPDLANVLNLDQPGAMPLPTAAPPKKVNSERGEGDGKGKGYDGSVGTGPGGSGVDSTHARGQRWVLRFTTSDGLDYLNQLAALGAEVVVPLPHPAGQKPTGYIVIRDPKNPSIQRRGGDEVLPRSNGQLQLTDRRPGSLEAIRKALNLDFTPAYFGAFISRDTQEDLGRKEKSYRNRKPENIELTFFKVVVRGGTYSAEVTDQTVRK